MTFSYLFFLSSANKSDLFDNIDWRNYAKKFNPLEDDLFSFTKKALWYKKNGNIITKHNYGRMLFLKKQVRIYKKLRDRLKWKE